MNRNVLAAGAITAVTALVIGVTWYDSPARTTGHVLSEYEFVDPGQSGVDEAGGITAPPELLDDVWTSTDAGLIPPSTTGGVLVLSDDDGIRGVSPDSGETAWSYHRDLPLCTAMVSEQQAVAVFEGAAGCAETTSLRLSDGEYNSTRRSLAPTEVLPLVSDKRSGVWSERMLELWRGDLVRTVEFGDVEASTVPDKQPFPRCPIEDAATRGDTLAAIVRCPTDPGSTLVLQDTDPDDSVEPELSTEIEVPPGSRLVAVGEGVAGYHADGGLWIVGQDDVGKHLFDLDVPDTGETPRGNRTELDHHTLWFTGTELVALTQPSLHERFRLAGAVGTGDTWGDRVLVPVADGIAVVDWEGETERVIPVHRESGTAQVDLRVIGDTVVEWRGDDVVALRAVD